MGHAGERLVTAEYASTPERWLIYLVHLASYRFARRFAEGAAVLDYGCGTGYGSADLAEGGAARVTGVDVSAAAIDEARDSFQRPNLDFARIEPDRPLPFDDDSFDLIVSFQVIEHVPDPDRYLAEASRVLRPGAPLLLTTPNRSTRLLPLQRPWNRWHVREYSRRTLRRELAPRFGTTEIFGISAAPEVVRIELRRTRRAKWMTLPLTLPILPEAFRVRALERAASTNGKGKDVEAADPGFDLSTIRIEPMARPAMSLLAVARA